MIRQTAWTLPIMLLVIAALCFAHLVPEPDPEWDDYNDWADERGEAEYLRRSDLEWAHDGGDDQ